MKKVDIFQVFDKYLIQYSTGVKAIICFPLKFLL